MVFILGLGWIYAPLGDLSGTSAPLGGVYAPLGGLFGVAGVDIGGLGVLFGVLGGGLSISHHVIGFISGAHLCRLVWCTFRW